MKYRIVEEDGFFYPQYKTIFFIWSYYCDHSNEYVALNFKSIEKAKKFILKKSDIPKKKYHYFN